MNIAKEPLGHIQVYCDTYFITLTGAVTRIQTWVVSINLGFTLLEVDQVLVSYYFL